MDRSICHCLSQVNKNLPFESIFTFLKLKKVPWITLLSTANFEQVITICHPVDFEQLKKHSSHVADFEQIVIILHTLNKS